jgi:ribosomal protein S26
MMRALFSVAHSSNFSYDFPLANSDRGRIILARKTILVCDNCSNEVPENRGAVMRINYTDARRGSKQADLCDDCAASMPGQAVARRGRRPKSVA